jgi:hypothetical protein
MHWVHDDHPDRRVRLAYCLNLHAAETFDDTLAGIRDVTLPLRDRIAPGRTFGVGMYLPHAVASALTLPSGARDLARLGDLLAEEELDPFTFNAFPYGGFHAASLKEAVFRPTWCEPERLAFTVAVAEVASALARGTSAGDRVGDRPHISISTHAGRFGPWRNDDERDAATLNLVRFALQAADLERRDGARIVLSIEPEPRSSANDLSELAVFGAHFRAAGPALAEAAGLGTADRVRDLLDRHVGTCLDACHAAVEFEDAASVLGEPSQRAVIGPLGKLQFSSALALQDPGTNAAGRERLLAMAEPRYLHQVTGRLPGPSGGLLRASDLPELAEAYGAPDSRWPDCNEWRCHFHVPVDLAEVGDSGLGTTSAAAGELLRQVLQAPSEWGTQELHLEIETYTWDVLPGAARGAGGLVDGLEREYRHVIALLERAGWHRC